MGVVVSADGTSMYFINHGNYTDGYIQAVDQYTLSTAWEINTASYTRRFNTGLGSVQDIEFSPDGTKMYALDNSNDTIYQYTLTTAWNVGTANTSVPTTLYSTSAKETSPYCFCLSPDGTKLLVGGTTGKGIDEFTLSTTSAPHPMLDSKKLDILTQITYLL
jgi:DNA-binding beta-propeller fold protein YncE